MRKLSSDSMSHSLRLQGKVALITGAASGIGEEAARLFADNGASVVIADVQGDLGRAVAASIGSDRATFTSCDVRNEKQVEDAVRHALQTYGRLDILFSNAGIIGPQSGILDLDMDGLDSTFATNLRGAAAAIKHAARAMVAGRVRGSIICTASVAASVGGMAPLAYTASKHAIVGLVKSACAELGSHGIRVNSISPFGVATPLSCGFYGWTAEEVEEGTAAFSSLKGIVLKTGHVAEATLFLASDDSAYITGHNLAVDGGVTVVKGSYSAKQNENENNSQQM